VYQSIPIKLNFARASLEARLKDHIGRLGQFGPGPAIGIALIRVAIVRIPTAVASGRPFVGRVVRSVHVTIAAIQIEVSACRSI
jgi:hypothetical protein